MRSHFGGDPFRNLGRLLLALPHAILERNVGPWEFCGLAGVVQTDHAGIGDVWMAKEIAFELGRRDLETVLWTGLRVVSIPWQLHGVSRKGGKERGERLTVLDQLL